MRLRSVAASVGHVSVCFGEISLVLGFVLVSFILVWFVLFSLFIGISPLGPGDGSRAVAHHGMIDHPLVFGGMVHWGYT